jgi:hypothetical protein
MRFTYMSPGCQGVVAANLIIMIVKLNFMKDFKKLSREEMKIIKGASGGGGCYTNTVI